MKKQRHVWVIEDEDGPIVTDGICYAYETKKSAGVNDGEKVVKYVTENKALVEAAKEALNILRYQTTFRAIEVFQKLSKALEVK